MMKKERKKIKGRRSKWGKKDRAKRGIENMAHERIQGEAADKTEKETFGKVHSFTE